MSGEPKNFNEFKADDLRQERKQRRREFFAPFWRVLKFVLITAVFIVAFNHRVEIQNVCYATVDRVMNYLSVPTQARQKAADYQNQLDGVSTN